ncbi:MAG: PAS domain S-box protein [Pleurocapsa minor GSE-CHR-MK-17-07R]|jgi:PAS domain S-box-containing protein|nr:PAS domain S-box protein [Pleurocapsa minor GSE-CHR-MK 17-07R]
MLALLDFRLRQRDFLLEISRAITERLELNEVLKRVVHASVVMLAGQSGVVALRDSTGRFKIRAVKGVPQDKFGALDERMQAMIEVASERDPEILNAALREMAAVIDATLIQTFAIPLTIAGEAVGLLIVFRNFQGGATPDDVQVLQSFADQAAIAVHNAQLYERIMVDRKQLAAVVQHSADGVMILDASLRIMSFNRALERMTGWSTPDVIGLPLDEVFRFSHVERGDLQEAMMRGWPRADATESEDEVYTVEADLVRRDGLSVSVGIRYAPLFNADRKLANIIANVRDVTNFRQAQQMQNVFISTVSHELRTPVTLIKGYAATLRREDVTWEPEFVREYSSVIEEEADRLTELIENLLTASRIQAENTVKLNLADTDIEAIASRSVERFRTQTTRHTFKLEFAPDFPFVQGDETRLRQVLDNLLSNAIKYSPDGGTIRVRGTYNDAAITISVIDQGVGLSEQEMEHVFERFYRADSTLSRTTQGTGLGLYLSKAIVEAHGGSIHVESNPGEGSTFAFTLPRT